MAVIRVHAGNHASPQHGQVSRRAPTHRDVAAFARALNRVSRAPCLALALAGTYAGVVNAAGANLAWNACLSEGGTANRAFACNANTGTNVLFGSFVLTADQPLCTGIESLSQEVCKRHQAASLCSDFICFTPSSNTTPR